MTYNTAYFTKNSENNTRHSHPNLTSSACYVSSDDKNEVPFPDGKSVVKYVGMSHFRPVAVGVARLLKLSSSNIQI